MLFTMKQVFISLATLFVLSTQAFAQSGTNNFIPELVFQNAVLVSGTAGQDGATYKFSNVAAGIDATVKINARSSSSVVLSNIDVQDMGWTKAFQPQLGIQGNVPANLDWWMDFEMCFYKAGTTEKKKIKGFSVTAIDVDGDGVSIREYLQMNKVKAVAYCPLNYLAPQAATTLTTTSEANEDADNNSGSDKKCMGPVQNFVNIDTAGTPVMATFTYENKDKITFRYGAKSGSIISNAGERLNSLWFKSFQLTPPTLLPLINNSYILTYDKRNVNMEWKSEPVDQVGDFTIERSIDNVNFKAIGEVKSVDGTFYYTYTDANVSSSTGVLYYRILYREKTGEKKYSAIKVVRLSKEATNTLTVYPTRCKALLTLLCPTPGKTKQLP